MPTATVTKENAGFLKNLDKMEKILDTPHAMDQASLCTTYGKIRPVLLAVLPVLEKIPAVGKIAKAIRLLMLIADSFCPAVRSATSGR